MFASSYVVGGTTINFGAVVTGHQDKGGAMRELTITCHFLNEGDWNNFRQQVNWDMEVVPMPWGNTVEILVKGGPGSGTLTIPGLTPSSYTAWLESCTRTWLNGRTGQSTGTAHFFLNAS
jgi:hypothetical protein